MTTIHPLQVLKKQIFPAVNPPKLFFWILSLSSFFYGMYSAIDLRWVCDDIYATFRYAENILEGHGWVYNSGEYVEGYTHFLWLCLITAHQWMRMRPETIVIIFGVLSYGAILIVFLWISYSQWDKKSFTLPLAMLILSLHYDFKIWATGGLETMFFTFLMVISFFFFFYSSLEETKRLILSGFSGTLLLLTRPDGSIFFFILLVFVFISIWKEQISRPILIKKISLFLLPFFSMYIPYVIWKISYYGDFFPNTYYAKSAGLTYWSQGFFYLWTYFGAYTSSLLCLLFCIPVLFAAGRRKDRPRGLHRLMYFLTDRSLAPQTFSLIFIIAYALFFIAKVGGDFMYARFLIPLIPFIYFLGESSLRRYNHFPPSVLILLFISLPLLVLYEKSRRDDLFIEETGTRKDAFTGLQGITDEHWFWTRTNDQGVRLIDIQSGVGKMLAPFFRDLPVTVHLKGQLSLGYYGRFSRCIEDCGLTDRFIAHLPIEERSRPGHEKSAPLKYLEQEKTDFLFQRTPGTIFSYRRAYFVIDSQAVQAALVTYNPSLLTALKARFPNTFFYQPFEEYLDTYLSEIPQKPKNEAAQDYRKFQGFYFLRNRDSLREEKFRHFLNTP